MHGHLENEKQNFLVGMFVEAEIITNEVQKIALPVEAFIEEDAAFYILVLTAQKENMYYFEKQAVKIGLKNERFIEILDATNLLKGKQILVKGVFTPLD